MSIGLYDIDLWHGARPFPNLDLMKTYNYLYRNNIKVDMLKKGDSVGRYSQVLYFKDRLNTVIPREIDLTNYKAKMYGYGFSGKETILKPEIFETPPSFLPYDSWSDKLSIANTYDRVKNCSIVKACTQDFSYYNKNSAKMYVVDHDFLQFDEAPQFLQMYKNCNFRFPNGLRIENPTELELYIRNSNLIKTQSSINFPFTEDMFYENYKEKIIFAEYRDENESDINYCEKITKIFLWHKKMNTPVPYSVPHKKDLEIYINKWGKDYKNKDSYYEYYKNKGDKKAILIADNSPTELRLLLKMKPNDVTKDNLDLKSNLIY